MNLLKFEKSPYLKQHQHNPIHWHAWGDEAFKKAKAQSKPVFLSIGYATCHWCHVMERESFEHQDVADFLNAHFVSIKVDREEHPDVDQIYMEALLSISGRGGWPMSMFLIPTGEPFYGGTYFPKKHFLDLLSGISEAWQNRREEILKSSQEFKNYLSQIPATEEFKTYSLAVQNFIKIFKHGNDPVWGGRSGSPKFPMFYDLRVLLRQNDIDATLLPLVEHNFRGLLSGGIYDHVAGGMARYSTDEQWLVPHFEKMLYDQASLLWGLAEVYEITQDPLYAFFIKKTQKYLLEYLSRPNEAFFSAEDADSEGIEGKFYVWPPEEIKKLLSQEEFQEVSTVFRLNDESLFEGGWILNIPQAKFSDLMAPDLQNILEKLRKVRDKRIRPLRDEKILSSWNGLAISSMLKSSFALRDVKGFEAPLKALDFLLSHVCQGDLLSRRWIDTEAKYQGTLEDYAFVIQACIDAFEMSARQEYLDQALLLQKKQDQLFWSKNHSNYFLTEENPLLIRRTLEFNDSVTPSGASVSFLNLQRLFCLTDKKDYEKKFLHILASLPENFASRPNAYSYWMLGLDMHFKSPLVLSLSGFTSSDLKNIPVGVSPRLIIKWVQGSRKEAILCEKQSCQLPVSDLAKLSFKIEG